MDLFVLPLEGAANNAAANKPIPFLQTEFMEYAGRFSPNGRWIAYQSNPGGKYEVYVRPFDASNPAAVGQAGLRQISTMGGEHPRWRGDGKEIYYDTPDGNIMAVEVDGSGAALQSGTPKLVIKISPGASWDATSDGKRFLVAAPANGVTATPTSSYQVVLNWPQMLKK